MKPRVVILAALAREIAPLVRAWPSHLRSRTEGWTITERDGAIAVCAGMGPKRIEYALELAERRGPISTIFSVGYAGGLREGIAWGSVHWPLVVIDAKTGKQFSCAGKSGTLVTADVVVNSDEKARLATRWSADLVDMESAVVARLAQERDLPFHSVRAVSDEFGDRLPDFNGFIDAHGAIRQMAFAAHLALHPSEIPATARLGRRSRLASLNLAAALQTALKRAE